MLLNEIMTTAIQATRDKCVQSFRNHHQHVLIICQMPGVLRGWLHLIITESQGKWSYHPWDAEFLSSDIFSVQHSTFLTYWRLMDPAFPHRISMQKTELWNLHLSSDVNNTGPRRPSSRKLEKILYRPPAKLLPAFSWDFAVIFFSVAKMESPLWETRVSFYNAVPSFRVPSSTC